MNTHTSSLTHNRWIIIFEAISRNTFDAEGGTTQFLMEDRKEADLDPLTGEEIVNIPFKRPQCQSADFKLDAGDGENISTAQWSMVKENFQSAGDRFLSTEGEVSKPPYLKSFANLWKGTESLDTTLGIIDSYTRVQLIKEL